MSGVLIASFFLLVRWHAYSRGLMDSSFFSLFLQQPFPSETPNGGPTGLRYFYYLFNFSRPTNCNALKDLSLFKIKNSYALKGAQERVMFVWRSTSLGDALLKPVDVVGGRRNRQR